MAKDKLTQYDSVASGNLDVGGISVAEGMLPSGVNNAIREPMSHQADAFGAGTPMYVDQTNNRLGIGNAAPTVPLDVTGAAAVSGALTAASATVTGDLTVDTSTLKVDSTNNRVGIANASPTTALDVTGDITVSGGVYLGGTGSANYLDDYEEGTYIPTVRTGTVSTVSGEYTKIGQLVTVSLYISTLNDISSSNSLEINLPFTCNSNSDAYIGSIMTRYVNATSSEENGLVVYISNGWSYARIYQIVDSASYVNITHSDYSATAVGIRLTVSYRTTA